ncbi:MAG: ATP-dependent DNA helicase RecG [Phototrophicales bacterium]|nr:ATP-dependent DNA helicase RecG [Phototrophicales bacterium]
MPSALEMLIKVLKLEQDKGYKNTAVIGGLSAYGEQWSADAHRQARKPEHHILVDEIVDTLHRYASIENKTERGSAISYLMDRITGRKPAPEGYLARLEHYAQLTPPPPPVTNTPLHEERRPEREKLPPKRENRPPSDDTTSTEASPRPPRRDKKRESGEFTRAVDDGQPPKPTDAATRPNPRNAPPPKPRKTERRPAPTKMGNSNDMRLDKLFKESYIGDSSDTWQYEPPLVNKGIPDLPVKPRLARPPRIPRPPISPETAKDTLRGLDASVETVKGVGPKLLEQLNTLGIYTINDLLFNLPRRHDDYTRLEPIVRLLPETIVTVIGTVKFCEPRTSKSGRKDFYMEVDDGTGTISCTFFGQHFLTRVIRKKMQLVISGKVGVFRQRLQMNNPEWEELDDENWHTTGIVPIYGLTEGLSGRRLRNLMREAVLYWADRLPDYMPLTTLERAELADLGWTVKNLHFPESQDHLEHARVRYIFDQLILLQMSIMANRRDWQASPAPQLPVDDEFLNGFIETAFPYTLTNAQYRAIADIRRDMASVVPMNRLLQGDVGSGKTAVAIVTLAMTFANGKQAALMSPTGILAEQHYRNISRIFDEMAYTDRRPVVALLTSSLTTIEREAVYNGMRDGSIDIVIGTHAIIQSGVEFADLGLAIIDEQHRFGVEQRKTLRAKGGNPHLLVMTATPIPRTMSLTVYADLDLSVMDEMPVGRTPVDTFIVKPVERERIYAFIRAQIGEGRQAFVIHPLVEASDKIDARSAEEAYEELTRVFHRNRVCLLHGRMKPAEKDEIMGAFARHEYDIMVTTSVAEVGVDIPNASIIAIEGANRFGLAQLHQFRGRVGRGGYESYCLLIPDADTPDAAERLNAMVSTTNGFELAEIDWRLRGAGDLIGTRQSGSNTLQLMEFMKPELVEMAQREARTLYEEDPYLTQPEHQLLKQRVDMLYNESTDVS